MELTQLIKLWPCDSLNSIIALFLSLFLPNAASLVIIRYLPCVPHPSLQLALTFFFDTLIAGDLYHPPVSAFDLQSPRRFTAPCIVLGTKTLRPSILIVVVAVVA